MKLYDDLVALPLYADDGCSGIDGQCTHPAQIRHPETGKFYCSGHARELAESHPAHMEDISMAVKIRQGFLADPASCDFCEKLAERECDGCGLYVCFNHKTLIPRTGAACPECADGLSREDDWGEESIAPGDYRYYAPCSCNY